MPDVINWNGTVWGSTTKGTVLFEMVRQGARFEGRITLFEPGLGQLQAHVAGEWSNENRITATLNQFTGNYSVPVVLPQTGSMEGTFDPAQAIISGDWNTDAGTAGKFLLVRIEAAQAISPGSPAVTIPATQPHQTGDAPVIPPLVTKTITLGTYRLDESAVRRLTNLVKSGTNVTAPAITVSHKGSEHIHIGFDNLLADPSVPDVVYNMIVSANEPAIKAGTNTVIVNLKKRENNILYVSGYNQIWVEGKAVEVRAFLEEHESRGTHFWRRYGSNVNSFLFLAMLALLPSIQSLIERVIVVFFALILLWLVMSSWRYAANTKIFLRGTKFTWYQRNSGWLLVVLEVALTAWVAFLIQHFIAKTP